MAALVSAQDTTGRLDVKNAVFARSGIYIYSREEVAKWGVKPAQDKPFYREYRPAGALVAAKDKFDMVPVAKEHPDVDISADNFHQYASGTTGGPIEVVTLDNGEIGIQGKIAFFTRDAYDYYNAGNRETSAGYDKVIRTVKNPDEAGYDFIMTGVTAVNHVCITGTGRGGSTVRVLDSIRQDKSFGGSEMGVNTIGGFLASVLGIGKAKDTNFTFSSALMDSVAKARTLDAAGIEKEAAGVLSHIAAFGDSEARALLIGSVTDCFKYPAEVLARKEDVAKKIDELYVKCQAVDAAVVKRILDSAEGGGEKKGEKEKKDGKEGGEEEKEKKEAGESAAKAADSVPGDFAAVIDEAVRKAAAAAIDGVKDSIDASVKKMLGLEEPQKPGADTRSVTAADSAAGEDASFLVRGIWGNR